MTYTCAVCGGNVALVRLESKSKHVTFNKDGSVKVEKEEGNDFSVDAVCLNDESHNIGSKLRREIIERSDEFVDI